MNKKRHRKNSYAHLYFKNAHQQNRQGFTLIELLVVISLIALFASIVLASLNTARAKARDAQILSDIKTLQTVMELYYDDHGYYPPATNEVSCCGNFSLTEIKGDATKASFKAEINPYLKQLPNPTKFTSSSFKTPGWGGASGGFSRINYNRPWAFKGVILDETGIACDTPGFWSVSKDCYILTVRTETKTTLGPAETMIYLITGKNGNGKIIDTANYYTWGLW